MSVARVDLDGCRDGSEIVRGVRLRAAPGHRPEHACVEFVLDGERFVHLADSMDAREHVTEPEWAYLHDGDREQALATRRALIEELADTGTIVACSHIDSFGRIERDGEGTPRWVDVA